MPASTVSEVYREPSWTRYAKLESGISTGYFEQSFTRMGLCRSCHCKAPAFLENPAVPTLGTTGA